MIKNILNLGDAAVYCDFGKDVNQEINTNVINYFKNIKDKKFQLIDARGEKRFLGLQPEPREGMRSGHIEYSKNLPFQLLINQDRTLKKINRIETLHKKWLNALSNTTKISKIRRKDS